MITAEQLKDVQQRTEALHRYLNIDQKQIEYEEEQLRTQAPDFWDDPKRAEAQMKKVKGIEKWLKDYKEVSTLTDELSLAVDFFKDEIVSEEEVDALYNAAPGGGPDGRSSEDQLRSRRHGEPGLGPDAHAYVHALERGTGI